MIAVAVGDGSSTPLGDLAPLTEVMAAEQWMQLALAISRVQNGTGHGQVVLHLEDGHPRLIECSVRSELTNNLRDVAQAVSRVQGDTGNGRVSLIVKGGQPRFIEATVQERVTWPGGRRKHEAGPD